MVVWSDSDVTLFMQIPGWTCTLATCLGLVRFEGGLLSFESLLGLVGLVSSSRQVSLSRVSPWAASSVVQLGQLSVFKVNRSDHLGSASPEDVQSRMCCRESRVLPPI